MNYRWLAISLKNDLSIFSNIKKLFVLIINLCFLNIIFSECEIPKNTIAIKGNNILYNTVEPIAGFQFNVVGADVSSARLIPFRGSEGFSISNDRNSVIGFSFTGATIPAGCGGLVSLTAVDDGGNFISLKNSDQLALANIIISDPYGNSLNFSFHEITSKSHFLNTEIPMAKIKDNHFGRAKIVNIKAEPLGAGAVITYDLVGNISEKEEIILVLKITDNHTGKIEEVGMASESSIDGDYGFNLTEGKNKQIIWDGIDQSSYYEGSHSVEFFVVNQKDFEPSDIGPEGESYDLELTIGHSQQDKNDQKMEERRRKREQQRNSRADSPKLFKELGEIFDGSLIDALSSGKDQWKPWGNTGDKNIISLRLGSAETFITNDIRRKFYFDHRKRGREVTYKNWEYLWDDRKIARYSPKEADVSGAWHYVTDQKILKYYGISEGMYVFKLPYADLRRYSKSDHDPPEYLLTLVGVLDGNGNIAGHWETYRFSMGKNHRVKQSMGSQKLNWPEYKKGSSSFQRELYDINNLKCIYPRIGKKSGKYADFGSPIQNGTFILKTNQTFNNGYTISLTDLRPIAKNKYPSLFLPKDEFETKKEYAIRVQEQKEIIYDVITEYTEEENQKRLNKIRIAEEEAIRKEIELENSIALSLAEISLDIESIDTYDVEQEVYPITVNGKEYFIDMPRSEARPFKGIYESIVVKGLKQLRKPNYSELQMIEKCNSYERITIPAENIEIDSPNIRHSQSVTFKFNIDGEEFSIITNETISSTYLNYLKYDASHFFKAYKIYRNDIEKYIYSDFTLHGDTNTKYSRYGEKYTWNYYSLDTPKNISQIKKKCSDFYADSDTNEDGLKYEYFNLSFEHPETGNIYKFGNQKTKDGINTQIVSTDQKFIPPSLSMKVIFKESNGNGYLDAEEKGEVKVSMTNNGQGLAFGVGVNISLENENDNIEFDDYKFLGQISPNETKTIEFNINANENVKLMKNKFLISSSESNGFISNGASVDFETFPYIPPNIVLIEHAVENEDDESIIEPGKFVNFIALVRNDSEGPAENVKFSFSAPDDDVIISGDTEYEFKRLNAYENKELNFSFVVPPLKNDESKDEINVRISIAEKKDNKFIDLSLPLKQKLTTVEEISIIGKREKIKVNEAYSLTIDIEENIPKTSRDGKNDFAIILGIEEYQEVPNVSYAKRDAKFMKKYFENVLGIPEKNIFYKDGNKGTHGTDVTKSDFDKILRDKTGWLSKRIKKSGISNIYFYYAGHGLPGISDKEAYLLPSEGDPDYIEDTGYRVSSLYNQLSNLDVNSVTVFLDACFSGESRDEELLYADARPVFIAKDDIITSETEINIFSASGGNEISSAWPEKKHGLFSYYLMKGLKGEADSDLNREITYKELGDYISDNVSETAGMLDKIQNPFSKSKDPNKIFVKY